MMYGITESFLDTYQLFFQKACLSFETNEDDDFFTFNEEAYNHLLRVKNRLIYESKLMKLDKKYERLINILLGYCDKVVTSIQTFGILCEQNGYVTGKEHSLLYYPIISALLSFRYFFDFLVSDVPGLSLAIIHNASLSSDCVIAYYDLNFDEEQNSLVRAVLTKHSGCVVIPVFQKAEFVIGTMGADNQFTINNSDRDILEYLIEKNGNKLQLRKFPLLESM